MKRNSVRDNKVVTLIPQIEIVTLSDQQMYLLKRVSFVRDLTSVSEQFFLLPKGSDRGIS